MNHAPIGHPRGVAYVELLVALALIVVLLSGVFAIFLSTQAGVTEQKERLDAIEYASAGLEYIKILRNEGWNNLEEGFFGIDEVNLRLVQGGANFKDRIKRRIEIRSGNGGKTIYAEASWPYEFPEGVEGTSGQDPGGTAIGTTRTVRLLTVLTPWR